MMPGDTFEEKLRAAAAYGFDGVEIRLFEEDASDNRVAELKNAIGETGLGACSLIMPGETYRKPLLDEETLEAKILLSKKAIDVAAQFGCPTIVCPEYGYQNPLPLFDHPRRPDEAVHGLLIRFLREVSAYAEEKGAVVMIEPINRYETRFFYTLEDGNDVINEVGSDNLKLLADLFHMNIEEIDTPRALKEHCSRIAHVHLGDSNRLLPGQGHTDFRAAFKALNEAGYAGYAALECSVAGEPDKVFPACIEYLREASKGL